MSRTPAAKRTVDMQPLPRGRHRLSRSEVEASQRARIVRALAEEMAAKGYARTSVADVLRRARVSRETFYELFGSKEDCFMSAFEAAYDQLLAAIAPRAAGDQPPLERLGHALEGYLAALASDPTVARVFLIEVYAAGPAALERRLALQRRLVAAITELLGAEDEDDRFAIEALIAATIQLVTGRLAIGDAATLGDLHGPLVALAHRLGLG